MKENDSENKNQYQILKMFHEKFLKRYGVKLPKLFDSHGKYTKDALTLIYLSRNYPKTKLVTKTELTGYIRKYYPETNDVQQARHLGAQAGWWIVAGGRDNIVLKVPRGSYQLYTLERPYPGFKSGHRIAETDDWEKIKKLYNFRCATCGSQENMPHLHWPATKTILQISHMDPNKPLVKGNILPQCQKCNRPDRNRWVYDEKGRVIKLADANFVRNFDKNVREIIYRILYEEFNGKDPNGSRKFHK